MRKFLNNPSYAKILNPLSVMGFSFGFLYFVYVGVEKLNYHWNFVGVLPLLSGEDGGFFSSIFFNSLTITLKISAIAFALAVVIGFFVMLLGRRNSMVSKFFNLSYIEIIRNTPVLIQIYLIYYIISPIVGIDRFYTICIGLAIFESAYLAEIFRASIKAVPVGQWEASISLNLSKTKTYTLIIMPQAARLMIPPVTGTLINIIKNSSIASVIAVADLVTETRNAVSETFLSFELWFSVALVYLVINFLISSASLQFEKYVKIKENE